jgi:hypothetical protein
MSRITGGQRGRSPIKRRLYVGRANGQGASFGKGDLGAAAVVAAAGAVALHRRHKAAKSGKGKGRGKGSGGGRRQRRRSDGKFA